MTKKILPLLLLFFCASIFASDIFVDLSAPAGGDGSSWANAYQDIQSAVTVASANDFIFIAEGIYRPAAEIRIDMPLTIRGGYPAGGGIQDVLTNITQLQADLNPGNLLFRVLRIDANAEVLIEGVKFFNVRTAIESSSNITVNSVTFDQVAQNGISLRNTITYINVNNSLFTNNSGTSISGSSANVENVSIINTIFENGTARAILFNPDDANNFIMRDCILRRFDTASYPILIRGSSATITNFLAQNNTVTGGQIIFYDNDTGTLNIKDSRFLDNTGENGICLQVSDGNLILKNTDFINNLAGGTFAYPVMNLTRTNIKATNCKFIGNEGVGSQSYTVSIRDFGDDITAVFENCEFRNNIATGSISRNLFINGQANVTINNCVFDNNSGENSITGRRGATITNTTFINNPVTTNLLYVLGNTSIDFLFENNRFYDNTVSEISISYFNTLNGNNNSYFGEVDLTIDNVINAFFTNDTYRGNTSGDEFINFTETTSTLENVLMISTKPSGGHTLIKSNENTSLNTVNSTFSSSNIATTNVSLNFRDELPSSVRNTIIWSGNDDFSRRGMSGNTSNLSIEHSLVKGVNPAGANNLDGTLIANAPIFVSPDNLDFRLQDCSPTINVGSNAYTSEASDLNGNRRIVETTIDLGAYEIQRPKNASCSPETVPSCTDLSFPMDGDIDVDSNLPNITWLNVPDATGYRIAISSASGNNDFNLSDVFNTTQHSFTDIFEAGEIVSVTIIPYNGIGEAIGCDTTTQDFTISTTSTVPEGCSDLVSPTNGATDVVPDIASISWESVTGADAYRISISGSSSTANNITNEIRTGTFYSLPGDFDAGETVTVTVVPLNGTVEPAMACDPETFTIVAPEPTPPGCTSLTAPGPTDGDTDVAVDLDQITWNALPDATQYRLTLNGSTSDLNDVSDLIVAGTSHMFTNDFENGETVTVTVVPLNGTVEPVTTCNPENFTIASSQQPPELSCSDINSPSPDSVDIAVDARIEWKAIAGADGYYLSLGTETGNYNLLNNEDVGILTDYAFNEDFGFNTTIYVLVTPYSIAHGSAQNCDAISFTTVEEPTVEIDDETKYGFSPDGDGINEVWEIDGIENHPENTVFIYNRWGDLVFQIEGYNNTDNVFNGEANRLMGIGAGQLPSGTYFFKIQVSGEPTLKKLNGYLVLKR